MNTKPLPGNGPLTSVEALRAGGALATEAAGSGRAATLTPDASRLARQELGMSQAAVSQASGVQAYIIKQWEAGRFRPPAAALDKLRDYYEAAGVDLESIWEHLAERTAAASPVPQAPKLGAGFTANARPGFFLAEFLTPDLLGKLMERMEANDDRVADILGRDFERGFLSPMSNATEASVSELMGTLAESYLLFRFMQGRNILASTAAEAREEPKTIGDFLTKWAMKEPVVAALFDGAVTATPNNARRAFTPALATADEE